jgi:hypothetical protein
MEDWVNLSRKVIRRNKSRELLQSQDTYTLHKPTKRRFPRRRVVVYGIDHQWQADLVDLAKLSSYNKGFKYLLTCIDVLSQYPWVVPLTLKDAFHVIFKAREGTSGHAQSILPVMTSLPVTWLHVTSFPVRTASGDVTSSNACVMVRSPLLPPKYALTCPDILLRYFDLGGGRPINDPWTIYQGRQSSCPLGV